MSDYFLDGRNFRTENDYKLALRDKAIIDKFKTDIEKYSVEELNYLLNDLNNNKYRLYTILKDDFCEELEEIIISKSKAIQESDTNKSIKEKLPNNKKYKANKKTNDKKDNSLNNKEIYVSDDYVQLHIKRNIRNRKILTCFIVLVCIFSFGYLLIYDYFDNRTSKVYDEWAEIKDESLTQSINNQNQEVTINYTSNEKLDREVLDEYKILLNKNKKLIGWLKIDDTNIDYPVMQTSDNEYYLDHNMNQEYDKNGTIFMDYGCDVVNGCTNIILYGHHMRNGQMFGYLDKYEKEDYYKEHKKVKFDTIYEKGTYQVMYVFRSKVYSEEEIVFKYYQFINANSETEFNSYMREMAEMSFYDTGVTASFGDKLLTLSTCDYQETNGRFVVVCKKID